MRVIITRPGRTRTRTCPPPLPQKKESYLFLTWPPPPSSPRPNPNPNPNLPPSPAQEKKSPTFSQPGHHLRPRRTRTRTRTSTCPCQHRARTRTRNLYTPPQKTDWRVLACGSDYIRLRLPTTSVRNPTPTRTAGTQQHTANQTSWTWTWTCSCATPPSPTGPIAAGPAHFASNHTVFDGQTSTCTTPPQNSCMCHTPPPSGLRAAEAETQHQPELNLNLLPYHRPQHRPSVCMPSPNPNPHSGHLRPTSPPPNPNPNSNSEVRGGAALPTSPPPNPIPNSNSEVRGRLGHLLRVIVFFWRFVLLSLPEARCSSGGALDDRGFPSLIAYESTCAWPIDLPTETRWKAKRWLSRFSELSGDFQVESPWRQEASQRDKITEAFLSQTWSSDVLST